MLQLGLFEHVCPQHGPMKLVEISSDFVLGYAWFCVNDDAGSRDYCDECQDATDDEIPVDRPKVGEMSHFVTGEESRVKKDV